MKEAEINDPFPVTPRVHEPNDLIISLTANSESTSVPLEKQELIHKPTANQVHEERQKRLQELRSKKGMIRCIDLVEEFINTENIYVNNLRFLAENFFDKLTEEDISEIYPVAKLNIMFENFENVLEVAENFLEELRSAKAKLGHICCIMYKKKDDFQKVYCNYIKYYPRMLSIYGDCLLDYPDFSKFVQKEQNTRQINFISLFMQPVQRLPKYLKLITTLKEEFDEMPTFPRLKRLDDILLVLQRLTSIVNSVYSLDDDAVLSSIENNWFNNTISIDRKDRHFVTYGYLKKIISVPYFGPIAHRRYLFCLFSDMLLWCTPPNEYGSDEYCHFVGALPVQHVEAHAMNQDSLSNVWGLKKEEAPFRIHVSRDAKAASFVVVACNEQQRETWVTKIMEIRGTAKKNKDCFETQAEVEKSLLQKKIHYLKW